jgi:hypothetical protein
VSEQLLSTVDVQIMKEEEVKEDSKEEIETEK